jgi:uncharacterized membrane protein (DUF106 family)
MNIVINILIINITILVILINFGVIAKVTYGIMKDHKKLKHMKEMQEKAITDLTAASKLFKKKMNEVDKDG